MHPQSTSLVRRLKRVLRRVPVVGPAAARTARALGRTPRTQEAVTKPKRKSNPQADALLESGLFNADLYAAARGREFSSARAAAVHYVKYGAKTSAYFHPLIAPEYLPAPVLANLRKGAVSAVVAWLGTPAAHRVPWGPLFDARTVADAGLDPLEVLRTLADGDALPVDRALGEARATSGIAQAEIIEATRRLTAATQLTKRRAQTTWDLDEESVWLAELAASDVTLEDDGDVLVSVIMPVWNRASMFVESVRSVQEQSLANWQLVLVDDGSTDTTVETAMALAAEDPRITVVTTEHAGVSAARNAGLAAATGAYIAFLDSDNTWHEHFLSTMVRAMRRDELRAAYSATRLHGGDGSEPVYRAYEGGLDHLLVLNHIDLNVLVVEASIAHAVGGFDTSLRRWVDHDFAIKVARHAEPRLLPFIGCEYDDSGTHARITTSESDAWQYVVLGNAWVPWEKVESSAAERVAGRVSVLMPVYQDFRMTVTSVRSLLDTRGELDLEIVVVDNGSARGISLILETALAAIGGVRYVRLPRNFNFATGSNYGFALSTGNTVIFLNNDTVVRDGWADALLAQLDDQMVRGVQPLLLYPDDTIQAAGTVFPVDNGLPIHLIAGHPKDDGRKVAGLKFSAVTAAALMMRAEDVTALRGFDPIYANGMEDVDLCLRAIEKWGGHFAVAPDSIIEHHESKTPGRGLKIVENRQIFLNRWRGRLPAAQIDLYSAVGLEIAGVGVDRSPFGAPRPILVRPKNRLSAQEALAPRHLRWSIKNPAVPGVPGDVWGDTHFIDALAERLRRHGQDVVVYRHGTHDSPATAHDDVNLVIRGLDRAGAQPGKINVLWVISHPEAVTVDEVREYDLVFAASISWAAKMTRLSGREVKPLLQATDPGRFATRVAGREPGTDIIFVGQARRHTPRQIVMDALSGSVPVKVWGQRWDRHISAPYFQGEYLENERLGSLYRAASIVLNDHWSDMASEGFISNRLFDAVAAGARVVSDRVEGIAEIFEGAVQTYSTPAELVEMCGAPERHFPDAVRMREIAVAVAAAHSFDARAVTLMKAVEEFIADRFVVEPAPGLPPGVPAAALALEAVVTTNSFGRVLLVDPKDPRGRSLASAQGLLNPGSHRLWRFLVEGRSWDLVVDVGANYGEMMLGAAIPPSARVVAFEPQPRIAELLRASLDQAGLTVEVVESAVSDTGGEAMLHRDISWSGMSSLETTVESHEIEDLIVPTVTLDSFFADQSAVSLCMKIDVEGHELSVLAGMKRLVETTPEVAVMVEALHMADEELADLATVWQMFALDERYGRLVRVGGSARSVAETLRGGWCYSQDVVLVPAGRPLPWSSSAPYGGQ